MHFLSLVESDRNALWLLLQDQVGAMTRSLDLNHPIITDIWMTECSKKHRGKSLYSLGSILLMGFSRPSDGRIILLHIHV